MIYLIAIPHTTSPVLQSFNDEKAVLNYANDKASEKSGEYFETIEDAKDYLTHDLSAGIWIENETDLEYAKKYKGHQSHEVHSLSEDINVEMLGN